MKKQLGSRLLQLTLAVSIMSGMVFSYAPPASAARYGPYRLRNGLSGKCMDFNSSAATAGLWIVQMPCPNGYGPDSQKFWLYSVGANINEIRSYKDTSKCLDVQGSSPQVGARLILWNCTGNLNQRFYDYFPSYTDGYHLQRAQHSGQCLQVHGGITDSFASITQWNYCSTYPEINHLHFWWKYLST